VYFVEGCSCTFGCLVLGAWCQSEGCSVSLKPFSVPPSLAATTPLMEDFTITECQITVQMFCQLLEAEQVRAVPTNLL
jgi:hypothetical protein